jgi:hypothetical protein
MFRGCRLHPVHPSGNFDPFTRSQFLINFNTRMPAGNGAVIDGVIGASKRPGNSIR